jgi:DNA-binding response OmpR family regulator
MNDFLTKPIDTPRLRHVLARHVRRAPDAAATTSSVT